MHIYIYTHTHIPNSSDCWVSSSGFGSGSSFVWQTQTPKLEWNWKAGPLERWNLLSSCKAGFMGLVRALAADLLEESGSPARSDSAGSTLASGNIGCACTQKSDG